MCSFTAVCWGPVSVIMYSFEDIPRLWPQIWYIQIWNQPCESTTLPLQCFLLVLCVWLPHIINGLITELSVFLPVWFTFSPLAFSRLTIRPTIDSSLWYKPSVKVQQFCHRVYTHTYTYCVSQQRQLPFLISLICSCCLLHFGGMMLLLNGTENGTVLLSQWISDLFHLS